MDVRRLRLRLSPSFVVSVMALVVALSGVTWAAFSQPDGTIRACVTNGDNRLRVLAEGASCTNKEVPIALAESGRSYSKAESDARYAPAGAAGGDDDADTLDGKDSTDFLSKNGTAADSDKLDGKDSAEFLGVGDKAADSQKLDGKSSAEFLAANGTAADSQLLGGLAPSDFLRSNATAGGDLEGSFDDLEIKQGAVKTWDLEGAWPRLGPGGGPNCAGRGVLEPHDADPGGRPRGGRLRHGDAGGIPSAPHALRCPAT